tara:strand:- start:115 stop:459 length:345 start_codon:yes stop_codon:yes gene_type:complete
MSNDFLLKVADVLDAIADEKSQLETQLSTIKHAQRQEKLNPIVEKLSFITGDDPDEVSSKLAGVDDSVLSMLSGLAGSEASPMGSSGTVKTAGLIGGHSNKDRADRDFANWILS